MQSVKARDPLIYHEFLEVTNLALYVSVEESWFIVEARLSFGCMYQRPRFSNVRPRLYLLDAQYKVVAWFR